METVGLGQLGYQTDHAQKSPQTLALMQARLYARLQKMLFCTNEDGQKHECGIVSDSLCPFYFFNVLTTPEEKPAVDMSDISSEDSGSNNTVYNNVYLWRSLPWVHHNKIHILDAAPFHCLHKRSMLLYSRFTFCVLHCILRSYKRGRWRTVCQVQQRLTPCMILSCMENLQSNMPSVSIQKKRY